MSFEKINKEVYKCLCERCSYQWDTKTLEVPLRCPKCKTPYWNKPRKNKFR